MFSRSHFPQHQRPEWWPANEHWPPERPPWRARRGRFFLRLGCLFLLFNFFVAVGMILFVGLVARWMGWLQVPAAFNWAAPVVVVLSVLAFIFLAWTGRGLRRISAPFGDLMDASNRVAEGDYTARVAISGPAEVRGLAAAFNSMAERLEAHDAQRRNLMADVTHELRTPLTIIQGELEGMLDGVYAADDLRLKSLLEETQLLSRLVEDLRTLASSENGTLQLRKEPTDLALLIEETAAAFGTQAEGRDVTIDIQCEEDAPLLNVDPERLRQVLSNLISNSLRYTPQGGRIGVRYAIEKRDGREKAVIEIADNGAGIRPEDLEHIFDRFYKANDSGGMGLGLTIARNLTAAHGGTLQVSSEYGQGAMMLVSLPVATNEDERL
jgi:signal transduction histidine kinase